MENKITNTFYMKLSITELKCQALEIKKKNICFVKILLAD